MGRVKQTIEALSNQEWYRGQIEHIEKLPKKDPEYQEIAVSPETKDFLEERSLKLYTHQAKAIELIRDGSDVIITTPTASGKTLAFNIPILERLREKKAAKALYIYPTKALSNDQLKTLEAMEKTYRVDVHPAVYDGDTPKSIRPHIRRASRIVLTNPYGLHHYLPWHGKWRTFYENLDYVVMDEVHRYRGVFGSNIAMLVRRMLRVCKRYGSDPQFILSSATIANPREFSEKLTGRKFKVVSDDGSASGKKYFVFWNPMTNPESSMHVQTSELLVYMVDNGFQTLCFTISRKMAELIARWSREKTSRTITAYRAGYMPEERRKIEKGLKTGVIRGVASTNALELGMDIGGLDVVLTSGYPGMVISTWQQAGRAGRGREEAAAFFIAFENPLDQYFMKHPDRFFEKSHEHAVIDLGNPYISMGHLMCAASELPLTEKENLYSDYEEELRVLARKDLIHKTQLGYVYSGTRRPAEFVKLNNISEESIMVVNERGELLETMERNQAYREAHDGAVLLHQGESYIVKNLDLEDKIASVLQRDVDYYTEPRSLTDLHIVKKQREIERKGVRICYGEVNVSESYTSYRVKKFDRLLAVKPLDLPPINFESESTWLEVPQQIVKKIEKTSLNLEGGLHAIEHAIIAMTPFHAICDRWDIGGVSSPLHPDTGLPSIFIYDSYQGGIGISEKCFQLIEKLLETTYELIRDCDCEHGCPSCIYSPKCGNNNEPLDKQAAIKILEILLQRVATTA
ncbi:MAG: DEAD/DEAH box helicase [Candidatus Korarchaeota archaeon]|nr:DEAD/DEAH box helicase [Candidatus Korarchaeota archaeon]NIU83106.1 DEAD/DEAH box helicase [Candidatus Thorarchaeota archaeon]NIW13484.1 DEAD/DEAH box helicase [Candidatus Thorarchaeota archaeon]